MDFTLTTDPPGIVDLNTADAPTETAPDDTTPAALTSGAPSHTTPAALTQSAPGATTPAPLTTDPAVPRPPPDGNIASLPSMPASFIPAFIELTGPGPSLETLPASAADAAVSRVLQGLVGGALKTYQVVGGTDAQELPGIVHPINYDAETNPFIFVEC